MHYRRTVPSNPAFGGVTGAYPHAEARAARQLSLPIHPYLRESDVGRIVEAVTARLAKAA